MVWSVRRHFSATALNHKEATKHYLYIIFPVSDRLGLGNKITSATGQFEKLSNGREGYF